MDDMSAIYQQHAQTVYKFLLAQCHDPDLAEELTQETFYQAVRSIGRFYGSCKVSVWLCQIAKHLWYQHLRKHRREVPMPDDPPEIPVPSSEDGLLEQDHLVGILPQGAGRPSGTAAEHPQPAAGPPGGPVSPGLRRSQLPGDWGCFGQDGNLGESDVLPEQGKAAERRCNR